MIKTPTVFILGAGASAPFEYPSGYDLMKTICTRLGNPNDERFKQMACLGHQEKDISTFRNALFYSGKSSVDAFLEHRTVFISIGKSAIAQTLIPFEKVNVLFDRGDWYQYFYDKLNTSFEEFGQNNISIITFNYDRSFDHYLFTALQNSYGKSDKECADKLKDIPIIHLYGQLSLLPWQADFQTKHLQRPYDADVSLDDIDRAAQSIKIIHETVDYKQDTDFQKAYGLLKEAEYIYFLGFGYDETNI